MKHSHTGWQDYKPQQHRMYNSMESLIEFVAALPGEPNESEHKWAGGTTWAQTLRLAREGWPEGMKQAKDLAEKLSDRIAVAVQDCDVQEVRWDVTGLGFDIAQAIDGYPECWFNSKPINQRAALSFVVNVCCSAGIPPETLMSRGIATSALVLALQRAGHPISLYVGDEMGDNNGKFPHESTYVKILDANYPVFDTDRAIFAMAHPAFFRQILFCENEGELGGSLRRQCGGKVIENNLPPELKENSLYLGSAHLSQANRWTDGGQTWIIEEYKRQTKEK